MRSLRLDLPGDLLAEQELTLRQAVALDVVHGLTGGVEGAWCSGIAAHRIMANRGFVQGCMTLRALEAIGLLAGTVAMRPPQHNERPYSRHAVFYDPTLYAFTREGIIEHWANRSRVSGPS